MTVILIKQDKLCRDGNCERRGGCVKFAYFDNAREARQFLYKQYKHYERFGGVFLESLKGLVEQINVNTEHNIVIKNTTTKVWSHKQGYWRDSK